MARDQGPMTDEELEEASEQLEELREEVREALAAELGGDAEDYRAEKFLHDAEDDAGGEAVPDGSE